MQRHESMQEALEAESKHCVRAVSTVYELAALSVATGLLLLTLSGCARNGKQNRKCRTACRFSKGTTTYFLGLILKRKVAIL